MNLLRKLLGTFLALFGMGLVIGVWIKCWWLYPLDMYTSSRAAGDSILSSAWTYCVSSVLGFLGASVCSFPGVIFCLFGSMVIGEQD